MNEDLRALARHITWRNIALGVTVLGYVALVIIGVLFVAAQAWQAS